MRWSRELSKLPWPDDVLVQGSDFGLVFSRTEPTRTTAFVEVFPPNSFIRGEGATLRDAEDEAWSKYVSQMACEKKTGHEFERRQYRNGAGLCRHCDAFRSNVFPELPPDPDAPKSLIQEVIEMIERETGRGVE